MPVLPEPCVCLITDRRRLCPDARTMQGELEALEHWLDAAIDVVDLVQIRERDLPASILYDLVRRVAARVEGSRTKVVVNDRIDVARAAAANGVHIRGDGPPVERLRAGTPAGWIVGRSVHGVNEARANAGADYLVFGTMFPTVSKPAGAPTQGLEGLRAIVASVDTPVLAVGGVGPDRAAQCRAVGAAGIAAIGTFLPPGRAEDAVGILAATEAFRRAMMA